MRVLFFQLSLLALSLSGLGLTGLGIDYVRQQIDPSAKPPKWPFHLVPPSHWTQVETLMAISAAIFMIAVFRGILTFFSQMASAHLVQRQIVVNLRSEVYAKLQTLSFRFFDENASGSIINRMTGDVQNVRMFVDGVIIQGVTITVSLAVYLIYMVNLSPKLTLVCLVTTPILITLVVTFSRHVRPAYRRNRELVDKMITTYAESIQGIQVIKGFAQEDTEFKKFVVNNEQVRDQQRWIFWRVSLFTPTVGFLTQVSLTILLSYGGYMVIKGELALGTGLMVFVGLLQQFSNQINNIAQITDSIQQSLIGARRVFEILDAPVEIQSPAHALPVKKAKGHVKFENVYFGYDANEPVLENIELEVNPGQCIAILGATGAGKSALMSLIPRFYDPNRGRVLLDGKDLRTLCLEDLRRSIGLVFQENFLFSTTIAANIAFGQPKATQAEIERAAKMAAAHDFIMKLPKGYETRVGEGGVNFSGGQRQRIAIARALLLEPSILLLDDPTAAIDSRTENEIFEAIDTAISGRTTFIVAHRLSTLRRADLIIVLKQGRIVQRGTHEELMKLKGPYQHVAMLQLVDQESLNLLSEVSTREAEK